jgi:hypothetical protein
MLLLLWRVGKDNTFSSLVSYFWIKGNILISSWYKNIILRASEDFKDLHNQNFNTKKIKRYDSKKNVSLKRSRAYGHTNHYLTHIFSRNGFPQATHIELSSEFESRKLVPRVEIRAPMLVQASQVYTPTIYECFQSEYERSIAACTRHWMSNMNLLWNPNLRRRMQSHWKSIGANCFM